MAKPVQVLVEAYAGTKTVARLGHRHIHRAPRVTTGPGVVYGRLRPAI